MNGPPAKRADEPPETVPFALPAGPARPGPGGRPPLPTKVLPALPRRGSAARQAAQRGRDFTRQGISSFHRAAGAHGADESGLTGLTYAVMANYAADAALAVGLANTLFFAAASGESRANVALYLLITVAPFALVAPVIGPLLDRLQQGRRWALATSFGIRAVLALVLAANLDTWLLYPCALGILVLSKSFGVLKAAVTPRVLPTGLNLVRTNSRLTVFGLIASLATGAVAALLTLLLGSPGALVFTALVLGLGVWLCLRIPAWVELTDGEIPTTLLYVQAASGPRRRRQPLGRTVLTGLWGNATIRLVTGFLTLFVAFVIKDQTQARPTEQVAFLAVLGLAAGVGSFAGNAAGARVRLGRPDLVVLWCVGAGLAVVLGAAVVPGLATAALAALVAAAGSGLAKVCLDATVQRDLPERSRASAFGRAETVLQLAWVFGGALGVLLPHTYRLGLVVVAVVAAFGLTQTVLTNLGYSMLPGLGGRRPRRTPALFRSR